MCNLYSITRSQDAMRRLFAISRDLTGNLPPIPGVFPDSLAPIVRMAEGERQLEIMRWGMPAPPQFGGAPITNIRNAKSPHWRRWLNASSRCLVPFTSFCEYAEDANVVSAGRQPAALRVRWDLDDMARDARPEVEPG